MTRSDEDYIAVGRRAFANGTVKGGRWLGGISSGVVVVCGICAAVNMVHIPSREQGASNATQTLNRDTTGFDTRWEISRHYQFLLQETSGGKAPTS
jgi:hypothetical protein